MTALGPGGGVGGGRPPERPTPMGRTSAPDKVRLVTCLSQKLVDLLGAKGFTVKQYGDVLHFREYGIEYFLQLHVKKGEVLAAQLVIGDKSCSLFIYEQNMTEAEELKLVENLKEILIGEVKKRELHDYWNESGLIPLLDKYKSELLELAAKPIPILDGPWPRPAAVPHAIATRGSEKIPTTKSTLIRLTSDSLAQIMNKYLNPHGCSANAAKDEQLRNYPKVIIYKGESKIGILSITQDLAWFSPDDKKENRALAEILSKIMIGKYRYRLDNNVYWYDAKIGEMTEKLQPDLKALQDAPKPNAAAPVKENGRKAGLADTMPHPVVTLTRERIQAPAEFKTTLISGKGKDAKLLFTSEHLAEALRTPGQEKVQVVAVHSSSAAQALVNITVNTTTFHLSITPLLATLYSGDREANYPPIIKFLGFIFGTFNPRPGKKLYICTINWPRFEERLGEKIKKAMGKPAEGVAAQAEKIALEITEPSPLTEKKLPEPASVSPTTKEASPVKTEYEEAVKQWAQGQLVEWLKAKFHEFKLEEMTFNFSEGRVNISVKATHQIFVKKEVDIRGVTNRILNFSLSVGEFGAFVRQIIPELEDLMLLQKALVNLGKSKQSNLSLRYPNLDIEKFKELIGKR